MKGQTAAIDNLKSEQFEVEELTADQLKDVNGGIIFAFMIGWEIGTYINDHYVDKWIWG